MATSPRLRKTVTTRAAPQTRTQRLAAAAQAQAGRLKDVGRQGRDLVQRHPKSSVGTAVLFGLAVGTALYCWRKRR